MKFFEKAPTTQKLLDTLGDAVRMLSDDNFRAELQTKGLTPEMMCDIGAAWSQLADIRDIERQSPATTMAYLMSVDLDSLKRKRA